MAWKLPRRGGGFDTSGFDTSGDETWQLARNVQPTDKGVYQQNWAGFTGLTPGGEDVNKYRQDWQDFSKSAEGYDLGTKKHLFMENYLGNVKPTLEDLKNRYPGAAELGMTPEDVYEQEELYKDAPKGYGWFNQGGIASLENRPGYAWAGLVSGAGKLKNYFGGTGGENQRAEDVGKARYRPDFDWSGLSHANEFTGASGPRHAEEFSDYERNSPSYNFSGEKDFFPGMSTQWMRNSALSDPGLQDDPTIRTQYDEDRALNELFWEGEFGTGIPRPRKNLARMYNPRLRAEGGQVNRPGYRWGGESGSYDIEKAPWQPLDSGYYGKSDWQYSGNRDPKGHMMGTWRQTDYGDPTDAPIREKTTFKTAAMDPDYFNYMNPYYDDEIARRQNARRADIASGTSYGDDEFGGSPRFTPAAPIDPGMWGTAGKTYGTTPDEVREGWGMEGSSETPLSTRLNRLRRGPWMTGASGAFKKLFGGWQEGGAVGLEPGIGSLMGYAKGGMVTRVKVPKGQSKWMKRFMNNMRDS